MVLSQRLFNRGPLQILERRTGWYFDVLASFPSAARFIVRFRLAIQQFCHEHPQLFLVDRLYETVGRSELHCLDGRRHITILRNEHEKRLWLRRMPTTQQLKSVKCVGLKIDNHQLSAVV